MLIFVGAAIFFVGLLLLINSDNLVTPPANVPFSTHEIEWKSELLCIISTLLAAAGLSVALVGLSGWCRGIGEKDGDAGSDDGGGL